MTSSTVKSYCRNCIAACGMDLSVEDNKIVGYTGDCTHPRSRGYKCIKGQAAVEFVQNENRLLSSLKRQSDGSYVTIDSQQASEEVGQRIARIVAEHGPRSVALYVGTAGNFNTLGVLMAKAWLSALASPNLFTSMTLDQSAKWVTIGRLGMFASGKHDLKDLDAVIIVGCNPVVSHSSFLVTNHPGKELRSAKQQGTKIIVVDPRVSETARLADLHLKIKPGEDPALLAGIIHHILDNDWHDQAFCDNYVQHLDELKKAVQPYTLEYVAARTGIPESDIARAAEIFATSRRKFIGSSTGPNMIKYCNLAEHLIESLNAICGAYRRAGDVVHNPGVISPRPVSYTHLTLPTKRIV